jgi:DNA-binding GntR family transcriptional regulator
MAKSRATLKVVPVTSPSRPDMVAQRLREAIVQGEIGEGDQLVEPDLVESFGVSRPTVREALQRLVQEGLLTAIPHRGVFVTTISPEDLADTCNARRAIETSAALFLMEAPDREAILAELREQHRLMTLAAHDDDAAALTNADMRFHEILVGCLRSRRLHKVTATLLVETRMCIARLEGHYAMPQEAVDEHLDIVHAIESGSPTSVIKAVRDHMTGALALLNRLNEN